MNPQSLIPLVEPPRPRTFLCMRPHPRPLSFAPLKSVGHDFFLSRIHPNVSSETSRACFSKQKVAAKSWKEFSAYLLEYYWREFLKQGTWAPGNEAIILKA